MSNDERSAQDSKYPHLSADRVRQFHQTFGHPVSKWLNVGTEELRALRVRLLLEEVIELADAAGLVVFNAGHEMDETRIVIEPRVEDNGSLKTPDITEMADALGDIDYVTQGAALVFGIPLNAVGTEIHASNMSKLGADGQPIYREDGKILKGPNYFKPKIGDLLSSHSDAVLAAHNASQTK